MKTKGQKAKMWDRLCRLVAAGDPVLVLNTTNAVTCQIAELRKKLWNRADLIKVKKSVVEAGLSRRIDGGIEISGVGNALERLLPLITKDTLLVFCKDALMDIKKEITNAARYGPVRLGSRSPIDIIIPPGAIPAAAARFSFAAHSIATKIRYGQMYILNPSLILSKDALVTRDISIFLANMRVNPIWNEVRVEHWYQDGELIPVELMDIGEDLVLNAFRSGLRNAGLISLEADLPSFALFFLTLPSALRTVQILADLSSSRPSFMIDFLLSET